MSSAKKQKKAASVESSSRTDDFISYLNAAISPFHCVAEIKRRLLLAGFKELDASSAWTLAKGGQYFYTRGGTAIVAFAVGGKYHPDTSGAIIVGAHTDSPCLKLKPVSKLERGEAVLLGVVGYGGGLWHTWFDRDLSVAGRALVKGADGKTTSKLVSIPKPIARVSNLAIHLLTPDERSSQGFKPSLQNHAPPVLATTLKKALWETTAPEPANASGLASARNHPLLVKLIAEELKVDPSAVEDFELQLIDTQPACVGGALDEFVYSGRLDNQCSCFQGISALIESLGSLADDSSVRCVALFDHEEVGSCSAMGAEGPLMNDTLNRISAGLTAGGQPDPNAAAFRARSFHLSTDMAHAVHPNYSDRHDGAHGPKLGAGLVIKHNANQRCELSALLP
jgi:aspartyl aminopeptidase